MVFFQPMEKEGQFDSRLSTFKNRGALKQDEIRRRREDITVEIRKQKREESLAKRRNFNIEQIDSDSDEELAPISNQSVAFFN